MRSPKDWIGSPESWGEWGMRAGAWLNELRDYAKENKDDLDDHIDDFNDHLATANWESAGLTFERGTSIGATRIADKWAGGPREKYLNGVRTNYHDPNISVEYDTGGSNEIARWNRASRRLEHHSAAHLTGAANYYSNWQNYGGAYPDGAWRRMPSGQVFWQGLVRRVGSTSGRPTAFILTSPDGRSSTGSVHLHVLLTSIGAQRVEVNPNGQLIYNGTAGIPVNGWISLDGLNYFDAWR